MDFRCAAASLEHADPLAGTASTVRGFLLIEHSGPWGVDALRDCRLPDDVCAELRRRSRAARVRTLLIRRHGRGTASDGSVRVFAAWADAADPWLEAATLPRVEAVLDLDLAALGAGRSAGLSRTEDPVFCVCTHGRHDACCAERGRPTMRALAAARPELAWEVSHIGGDRFAANLLVLPDGLYYGRVQPDEVERLVQEHLAGRLMLERLRGRSGFGFAVQAAELAVRRTLAETGRHAVRLVSSTTAGADTTVRFAVRRAGGGEEQYDVAVRLERRAARPLTCRATTESPVPDHRVLAVTPAP